VQSDAVLGDLRRELEAEKAQLSRRLAELGHGGSPSLSFDQNFADSSQVTAERAEVEALATSLQESLGEVEDALAKFDAGTYGKCESCGQDIAPARLEAAPAARLCINCASRR
jgi:RNA polymerase-binding transcription factor